LEKFCFNGYIFCTGVYLFNKAFDMVSFARISVALFAFFCTAISCKKSVDGTGGTIVPPGFKLNYGDSILYLQTQATDYIVQPATTLSGQYSGFPEGIEIDANTGAINVSKSETGLRYRISFVPTGGTDTFHTVVLLSGINFLDGFYKLNTADSVLRPVYNANVANSVPGVNGGSAFDEGSNCNSNGCTVNVNAGTINLAQTVRNGVFGTKPANNSRQEFQMNYRINDKSGKALNVLKVKLYYFDTMADVTQEVYDIISSRQGTLLRFNAFDNSAIAGFANGPGGILSTVNGTSGVTGINKPAKPRPPCIFLIAR
jgi:hypothetical protein